MLFFSCSGAESSHAGYSGTDERMESLGQQYQFFSELRFPVPETEAWKEKVSFICNIHSVVQHVIITKRNFTTEYQYYIYLYKI